MASILCVLATFLFGVPAFSAPLQGDAGPVRNVRFERSGRIITIRYDLAGSPDRTYRVEMILRRESDPSFALEPEELSGDAGSGVQPGEARTATWDLGDELLDGLEGDDYYFLVGAVEEREHGGISTAILAGSAAAAIAGVALAILLSRGPETPPDAEGYPSPPGRP